METENWGGCKGENEAVLSEEYTLSRQNKNNLRQGTGKITVPSNTYLLNLCCLYKKKKKKRGKRKETVIFFGTNIFSQFRCREYYCSFPPIFIQCATVYPQFPAQLLTHSTKYALNWKQLESTVYSSDYYSSILQKGNVLDVSRSLILHIYV